jgi:hypothetical protein
MKHITLRSERNKSLSIATVVSISVIKPVEGFVNQYCLDQLAEEGRAISFVTERIENISRGWTAKETYRILDPDEFIEAFELAAPDKGFETYSESRLRRIRPA